MSALCEREILCEYMGHRQGPTRHGRYYKNPCDWKMPAGKQRRYVTVPFRWIVVAAKDLEGVITEQETKSLGYVASLDPRA